MKSAYIITWVNNNGDDDGKDEEEKKFLSPTLHWQIQQVKKRLLFIFQSYYYQRPLLSLKEEEVEKEKVSGN